MSSAATPSDARTEVSSSEVSRWKVSRSAVSRAASATAIPSASASPTILAATSTSASGAATGAIPSSSSSLAIRYPSSFRFPMIELSSLMHRRPHRNRAQLPQQVVAQVPRLRQEVLERGLLDLFHFPRTAITGIQIVLEERAEIDLLERILLLIRDGRTLFCEAVALAARRSRSSSWRPTSSSIGTASSSSSSTGFSTISALIMSLSSSLLSASTDTICTRPGVRICRCDNLTFSLC